MTRGALTWLLAGAVVGGAGSGCRRSEPATSPPPQPAAAPAVPAVPAPEPFSIPAVILDRLDAERRTELRKAEEEVRHDPENPEKIAELGLQYLTNEHPATAAYCFDHAAQRDPDNFRWHHLSGLAWLGAGDHDHAARAFERTLAVNPVYAAAYLLLANELLEEEPERARALYENAAKLAPKYAEAYFGLGRSAVVLGDRAAAVEHFRKALTLAPDYADAHYQLATLYRAQGDVAKATEHLTQYQKGGAPPAMVDPLQIMIARRQQSPFYLERQAGAYAEAGQIDEAVALLNQLLEREPTKASTHHKLGILHANQGRFEEAAKCFRQASELDATHVEAKSRYGQVLVQLGRPAEGERVLREVLEIHPDHATTLLRLGLLLERTSGREAAVPLIRRAIELQPAYAHARLELGRLLAEAGQFADAIEELRTAVELEPDNGEAHHLLGGLLFRQGIRTEAMDEWRLAIQKAPKLPDPYLSLSDALVAQRDYAVAVKVLRTGLEQAPQTVELANNLAWLLATCSDDETRDGRAAVELAERMIEQVGRADPALLDTLATAYAAAGRFDEAVATQDEAIRHADAGQHPDTALRYQKRRDLFRNRQAFIAE